MVRNIKSTRCMWRAKRAANWTSKPRSWTPSKRSYRIKRPFSTTIRCAWSPGQSRRRNLQIRVAIQYHNNHFGHLFDSYLDSRSSLVSYPTLLIFKCPFWNIGLIPLNCHPAIPTDNGWQHLRGLNFWPAKGLRVQGSVWPLPPEGVRERSDQQGHNSTGSWKSSKSQSWKGDMYKLPFMNFLSSLFDGKLVRIFVSLLNWAPDSSKAITWSCILRRALEWARLSLWRLATSCFCSWCLDSASAHPWRLVLLRLWWRDWINHPEI